MCLYTGWHDRDDLLHKPDCFGVHRAWCWTWLFFWCSLYADHCPEYFWYEGLQLHLQQTDGGNKSGKCTGTGNHGTYIRCVRKLCSGVYRCGGTDSDQYCDS